MSVNNACLYYRLAVAELELPTLAVRSSQKKEDLLKYFIDKTQNDLGFSKPLNFTSGAKNTILNYTFPGNIRELENLVTRLYAFYYDQEIVDVNNLPSRLLKAKSNLSPIKNVEREEIIKALKEFHGNQKKQERSWASNTI